MPDRKASLAPPAEDRDRHPAPGIWPHEYQAYGQMSDRVRTRFHHHLNVRYGPDPRHLLDVYVPQELTGPAPVLVFFHGGALEEGHPRRYGFVGEPYLERGVVYVSAGYRLVSDELAGRRTRVEKALGAFVHQLSGPVDADVAEIRADVAQAGVDAATDARSALAWIHHRIAEFGGDPDRITITGHSSGAMVVVAAGCADDWQQDLDCPVDVVKAIVPVGGRYGLWLANAIISGADPADPPQQWALARTPRAVVVFGEEEYDDEGESPGSERASHCARIGRSLVGALQAAGGDASELALSPRGHWQTVRSLADANDRTFPAVLDLLGVTR